MEQETRAIRDLLTPEQQNQIYSIDSRFAKDLYDEEQRHADFIYDLTRLHNLAVKEIVETAVGAAR